MIIGDSAASCTKAALTLTACTWDRKEINSNFKEYRVLIAANFQLPTPQISHQLLTDFIFAQVLIEVVNIFVQSRAAFVPFVAMVAMEGTVDQPL